MIYPDYCYSNDLYNNCIIIKWGESGYYKTDYPEGQYNDEIIKELNERIDVTPEMANAMICCSMAAQSNPYLDWKNHYEMIMERRY